MSARLLSVTAKEMIRALERAGFAFQRQGAVTQRCAIPERAERLLFRCIPAI